ncbi:MAG: hypothetical protein R8J41_02690 [Alphaproteobacteria bacterium]|uniref:hypothetical protein n=1 Tax=Pyruvatibacter sp. HU-CL02332 TaxID=3127650 RepID=UPI002967EEA5|nr:hypothetical protein [Alphaproteobacteria bacterium]
MNKNTQEMISRILRRIFGGRLAFKIDVWMDGRRRTSLTEAEAAKQGKKPIFVGIDYKHASVWCVIYARSFEEVRRIYADYVFVLETHDPNRWPSFTEEQKSNLKLTNAYDIDEPQNLPFDDDKRPHAMTG